MKLQKVLVVLANDDAVCAYPIEDDREASVIRSRVQKRVEEHNTPRPRFEEDMLKVRLQVVELELSKSLDNLVDDILDKVIT